MQLDSFRTEVDTNIDTVAERVVRLGGTALGTTQTVANKAALKPYPVDIYKIIDHLAALIERYGAVANAVSTRRMMPAMPIQQIF